MNIHLSMEERAHEEIKALDFAKIFHIADCSASFSVIESNSLFKGGDFDIK